MTSINKKNSRHTVIQDHITKNHKKKHSIGIEPQVTYTLELADKDFNYD